MSHPRWRSTLLGASVATALLGIGFGTGPALAQSPAPAPTGENPLQAPAQERAAALVRPAIVYLEEKFTGYVFAPDGTLFNNVLNNGAPFEVDATCTGFGVNPDGHIATAGHCVDTSSAQGIKLDMIAAVAARAHDVDSTIDVADFVTRCTANCTVEGRQKGAPLDSTIAVVGGATTNGATQAKALPARVVDFRPADQGDVALLKVETTDQPSIELAGDAQAQVGTPVLSIGYPGDTALATDPSLEPTNKDGQISSKKTVGTLPVYETSAALTAGMSGGPTVGLDGRVLGLNSFKVAGETQPFNFIAPASALSELLARNGVRNQLGANDVTYRQGLADYFSGHYTSAIADFDRLLAVSPNQPQATQYKTLAAQARNQYGDVPPPPAEPSGPGVLLWVIISVAVLLATAAVLTVLLLRRRGRTGVVATPASGAWPQSPAPGYGPTTTSMPTFSTPPPPPGPIPAPPYGVLAGGGAATPVRAPAPTLASGTPTHEGRQIAPVAGPPSGDAPGEATAPGGPPATPPAGSPRIDADQQAGTRFCPECGAAHASTARFCPSCGAPQPEPHA